MSLTIPDKVLAESPWSYSKANCALTCPYKYHRQYHLKDYVRMIEPLKTRVGKNIHLVLEWIAMGMGVGQAFAKLAEVKEMTHDEATTVQLYRDAVQDFTQRLKSLCQKHQVHPSKVQAERNVGIYPDFTPTRGYTKKALFTGVVDLTLTLPSRETIAVDHKTGAVMPLEKHRAQLAPYAVVLQAHNPKTIAVQVGIHNVGADPDDKGSRMEWLAPFSARTVYKELRVELIDFLTRAAEKSEDQDPCKSWLCGFCAYKTTTCPLFG